MCILVKQQQHLINDITSSTSTLWKKWKMKNEAQGAAEQLDEARAYQKSKRKKKEMCMCICATLPFIFIIISLIAVLVSVLK